MYRIKHWIKQQVQNPQIVFLAISLIGLLLIVVYIGDMLAPVIAGIVMAYLLEGIVASITHFHIPRIIAVGLVFALFMFFLLILLFALMPLLYSQLGEMVQQIPLIIQQGQAALMRLPERYPELFSQQQMEHFIENTRTQITTAGQYIVTRSLYTVTSVISVMIYTILLPILVFFFLKDKDLILAWFADFLPSDHELATRVWHDVDRQTGNYVRGKVWEILIVWLVSFVAFTWFGLQFSMLLSLLVGLSVLIPYVGAAVVTIPVAVIAWFQWGWSSDFISLMTTYLIIQALDGNLLVPWIFSEVVNIHPVAIIVAILFFGGLWGLWGVFFAIPLATLIQAVIHAWPRERDKIAESAS